MRTKESCTDEEGAELREMSSKFEVKHFDERWKQKYAKAVVFTPYSKAKYVRRRSRYKTTGPKRKK